MVVAHDAPKRACVGVGPLRWGCPLLLAIALLAPSTAPAASRPTTTFAGATSQDNPVVVELSRDRKTVTRLVIHWDAKCQSGSEIPGGGVLETSPRPPAEPVSEKPYLPVAKNGRFKGASLRVRALSPGRVGTLIQNVAGKLGSSYGAGTWNASVAVVDTQTGQKVDECNTGTIRWTTPKPQTLYYGGVTSHGGAVVIQLSRNRRSVRVFRVGWAAVCQPDGVFSIGDALSDFRISRSGAFGDTFPLRYPNPDGSAINYDYELSGKIGRTKARGSFHVRRTDLAVGGVTAATCDSPRMTWSAKQ